MSAADAGGRFQEIQPVVLMSDDVFGMRYASFQSERRQQLGVLREQPGGRFRIALQNACGEDAAALRNLQGRRSVGARQGEPNLVLIHNRVHVKDVAGYEPLEQKVRLLVSEIFY